jgi:hypothetical protein
MRSFHAPVLIVSVCCLMAVSLRADTILSENFNELTPALGVTSAGAFSAVAGTNVDIVGPGNGLCAAPESGNCVDLDGTGGNPQGVLRSNSGITLEPGTTYDLSFDLIGSQRGTATSTTVTFGSLYDATFSLGSTDDTDGIVSMIPITVGSPTTAFLTFTSNTPGQIGAVLDNVAITSSANATSPVPEPSTLILLGSGVMGLCLLTRLRRALRRPASC